MGQARLLILLFQVSADNYRFIFVSSIKRNQEVTSQWELKPSDFSLVIGSLMEIKCTERDSFGPQICIKCHQHTSLDLQPITIQSANGVGSRWEEELGRDLQKAHGKYVS